MTAWNREWLVATRIEVDKIKEGEFQVRVIEATSESTYRVTLKQGDYRSLSDGKNRSVLVR